MNQLLYILLAYVLFQQDPVQTYRASYLLTYCPDSTNLSRRMQETFFLYMQPNGQSSYASEKFLKKDSISALVRKGVLSENDIIVNPRNRFTTRFLHFVRKNYGKHSSQVTETIGLQPYTYTLHNALKWEITTEIDTVEGYHCLKASTSYAGRYYEAWFTPDIPITDGPYVFWGLPGLIIKLADTRQHYVFVLQQIQAYKGIVTMMPTYRSTQPLAITPQKAFSLREEFRKNPFDYLNHTTGGSLEGMTFQRHGSSDVVPARAAAVDRRWDNNPLELK